MEEISFLSIHSNEVITYSLDGKRVDREQALKILEQSYNNLPGNNEEYYSIRDSSSGKIIGIYPIKNKGLLIYTSFDQYSPIALQRYLHSQATMLIAFGTAHFLRPIHMAGMHLFNLFAAPRVYPHVYDKSFEKLFQELVSVISPICALYAKNSIIIASDQFWKMSRQDIHAIDLLVRSCEAPFTDQALFREGTGNVERVCVFHIFKSMKFVSLNNGPFDMLQAASQQIPTILYKQFDLLKTIEPTPPIVNKQEGIVAWAIFDLATHRYFGDCPNELEHQFIEMICKCHDIAEHNRVSDISMRLKDHLFFFMPQVLVRDTKYFSQSHFWTFYAMHDFHKTVEEIRKFAEHTMINLVRFVKPINPPDQYLQQVMNRINT